MRGRDAATEYVSSGVSLAKGMTEVSNDDTRKRTVMWDRQLGVLSEVSASK